MQFRNLIKQAVRNLKQAEQNIQGTDMIVRIGLIEKIKYNEPEFENGFSGKFENE